MGTTECPMLWNAHYCHPHPQGASCRRMYSTQFCILYVRDPAAADQGRAVAGAHTQAAI